MADAIWKMPVMLLAVAMLGFSAAPPWVAEGASLTYSVGNDSVKFVVTGTSADGIEINVTPQSTNKVSRATENASADSGQFWFDSAMLASASVGSEAGDFTVTGQGTDTFAGRQWNTITLEDTVSGAKTAKVYDRESGLLLKQTVETAGVPVVTLVSFNIPGIAADGQSEPSAPETPEQQDAASTPPESGATVPEEVAEPAGQEDAGTNSAQAEGMGEQQATPQPQEEEKGKCASGAILLAVLGGAAFASVRFGISRK